MLPDDVAARLRHEARRRGVSVAALVREAVERHLLAPSRGEPLSFFAIGEGGPTDARNASTTTSHIGQAPSAAPLMIVGAGLVVPRTGGGSRTSSTTPISDSASSTPPSSRPANDSANARGYESRRSFAGSRSGCGDDDGRAALAEDLVRLLRAAILASARAAAAATSSLTASASCSRRSPSTSRPSSSKRVGACLTATSYRDLHESSSRQVLPAQPLVESLPPALRAWTRLLRAHATTTRLLSAQLHAEHGMTSSTTTRRSRCSRGQRGRG